MSSLRQKGFVISDWITDDFLKKIEDRPDLLKQLADPRYSQAITLFRTNPHQAWKLIKENQELQIFVKELCGILGEQFTAMADQLDQNVQPLVNI